MKDKVIINHDFYQTSELIQKVFDDNIAVMLLNYPQSASSGKSLSGDTVAAGVQNTPFESLSISDHVNVIRFLYEKRNGIRISGMYMYRTNRDGVEILSGTTLITESDRG